MVSSRYSVHVQDTCMMVTISHQEVRQIMCWLVYRKRSERQGQKGLMKSWSPVVFESHHQGSPSLLCVWYSDTLGIVQASGGAQTRCLRPETRSNLNLFCTQTGPCPFHVHVGCRCRCPYFSAHSLPVQLGQIPGPICRIRLCIVDSILVSCMNELTRGSWGENSQPNPSYSPLLVQLTPRV